jgi:hypothetical protein
MERLVHFNEKFSPEWRPRFLLYKSRFGLARAIVRVLQAEGHLRHFGDVRPTGKSPSIAPALPDRAFANAIG